MQSLLFNFTHFEEWSFFSSQGEYPITFSLFLWMEYDVNDDDDDEQGSTNSLKFTLNG